ncbi:hypothetical protein OZX65_02805 [Leuconostocaceae bacterium ESL0723]|nr:hypothetical protein OZX65_02805 [Leuconostocaceae bacterium ESL0723]
MNNVTVPGMWNLTEFTNLPSFNNWRIGQEAAHDYHRAVKSSKPKITAYKWIKWVAIFVSAIGFLDSPDGLMNLVIGIVFGALAFALRKNGPVVGKLNDEVNQANMRYNDAVARHKNMFIDSVVNTFISGNWRDIQFGDICLIYSGSEVVYFDMSQNLLLAYRKENIKEVIRERVHLGSSTTGTSSSVGGGTLIGNTRVGVGGAQTTTTSNTVEQYEWHFEILTDFVPYPKISLIFDDSQEVEDFLGTAYAVLKP